MKLRGLEALRAFMEGGSMNVAAERLNCTQPQVSRLLTALEEEVGFPLFDRKVRRLEPTAEARLIYRQIELALTELDEVAETANRLRMGLKTHVRVLAAPYALDALFLEPLRRLRDDYPQVTVGIDMRTRLEIEPSLRRERFDLGVATLPLESDELDSVPLARVPMVVMMSADHPLAAQPHVTVEDMVGEPLVSNATNTLVRRVLQQCFDDIGQRPDIRYQTPNGPVTCELAGRGFGLGLADGFVARSCLRPGAVMRLFYPVRTIPYVLFFPRWQTRSAAARTLATYIQEESMRQLTLPPFDAVTPHDAAGA